MKNQKSKIKNQKLLLLIFIIFGFSVVSLGYPQNTEAQCPPPGTPLVPCGPGTAEPYCKLCHFFVLFQNIICFILWQIVPPIAVLMIAIGGFYFFFTEGKPENVAKGKNIIKTTLIGLVIIFGAWLVVNLFFQIIGVQEWTNLKTWWQIKCP